MLRDLYYFTTEIWNSFYFLRKLKKQFPDCSFENNFKVIGPIENLKLGKNVQVQSNVLFHLGGMDWCQNQGSLIIGNNSCFSPNVIIYATGIHGVEIGENFDCGPGVQIFSSSSSVETRGQYFFKKVNIGDNVILYSNVVISPGVTIGDNAVVYAGAIVNRDIPENTVYGGVPAKYIKTIK